MEQLGQMMSTVKMGVKPIPNHLPANNWTLTQKNNELLMQKSTYNPHSTKETVIKI